MSTPRGASHTRGFARTGRGRVFYTAFGHDERVEYRGFQDLVERGTVWASNQAARPVGQPAAMPPIVYVDGFAVPNYENRTRRRRSISCRSA